MTPDASKSSSANSQGLLLVVDDQLRNLQVVKAALTRDGFEVLIAQDAQTALQFLTARIPDLILLDVNMPDMNGFDLCLEIKANPATLHIPIIFLSGDSHHDSIKKGFQLGGVDYVTKPFNKEELLARVRTHVELRQANERHSAQLLERNKVLNLIAQEWYKPLQRIVMTAAKMRKIFGAKDADTAAALASEGAIAERMLASIEDFLQQKTSEVAGEFAHASDSFSSEDLRKLASNWYLTAKRKQINIHFTGPRKTATIPAPSFMARQVVDAVVGNAISFTPSGAEVLVEILNEPNNVVLQVTDEGPGFPAEYLEHPYQPYIRRPQDRRNKTVNFGVGLAVAKRAADRIGATISIANRPTGGAIVRVTFPQSASAAAA